MKKMKVLLGILLLTFAVACGQADKEFNSIVTFNKGFRFSTTGIIYTSLPSGGTADWNTLLNKPTTFPSTWLTVSGKPLVFNPDLTITNPLYRPITWKPDYNTDILNKPAEVQLDIAISELNGIKLPVLTTVQINALIPAVGTIVYDQTLNVLKIYTGTWKVIITSN